MVWSQVCQVLRVGAHGVVELCWGLRDSVSFWAEVCQGVRTRAYSQDQWG